MYIPRQQLLGQHRECCALRGNGWGRPHATVSYVFEHPYEWLFAYHDKVMQEMFNRGYRVDPAWQSPSYRGKQAPALSTDSNLICQAMRNSPCIYPEHNDQYLKECLENLASKGIVLKIVDNVYDNPELWRWTMELKPCPFCGHSANFQERSSGTNGDSGFTKQYKLWCPNCGCTQGTLIRVTFWWSPFNGFVINDTELVKAVDEWNRRVDK